MKGRLARRPGGYGARLGGSCFVGRKRHQAQPTEIVSKKCHGSTPLSPQGCRKRADHARFHAAVRRHAGRRGGQYRAPLGHAGDRAGDGDRRLVRRRRLHLVGRAVGRAGAVLGADERPPRAQDPDPARRRRVRRLDDPVRAGAVFRARRRAVGRRDDDPVRLRPRDLRRARLGHAQRDPGLSGVEDAALGAGVGAVGAVLQLRPRHDRRPRAGAVVRAALHRPARAACSPLRSSRSSCSSPSCTGCPTTASRAMAAVADAARR